MDEDYAPTQPPYREKRYERHNRESDRIIAVSGVHQHQHGDKLHATPPRADSG